MYHTIIAVDVEKFSQRDAAHQRGIHAALHPLVRKAVEHCGLVWETCHHEDRGDGLLLLAPPDACGERLAECLPNELAGRLREYNHGAAEAAEIRLRVVIHAGDVSHDPQGVAGPAVVLAFRLLDSDELRDVLRKSRGVLALITSEAFFHNVIESHPGANPGVYQRIHVANRGTEVPAWIFRPDNHARPPARTPPHRPASPDWWWVAAGLTGSVAGALALWLAGWYLPHALVAGLVIGVLGWLTATAVSGLTTRGDRPVNAETQVR
jgi:hypothetical protein